MSFPMLARPASNPNLLAPAPLSSPRLPRSGSAPVLSAQHLQAYGPSGFATLGNPSQGLGTGGSFPTPIPSIPGTSLPGSFPPGAGQAMAPRPGEMLFEISRLLDMPIAVKALSNDLKQYKVRAFEDDGGQLGREVGSTRELAGVPESVTAGEVDTETIRLQNKEGLLRCFTPASIIHLVVEYAGGFIGNTRIGRCRIARADPRSRETWPYALSDKGGQPVGCGIELKVVEGPPMPPMAPGLPPTWASDTGSMAEPPPPPIPVVARMVPEPGPMQEPFPMAPFQTMPPPSSGPMPPPLEPSFHTMPPMAPPPVDLSFSRMPPPPPELMAPLEPSFHTMPQMGKGMKGGIPPPDMMGPSFQTMPPMGKGGLPPTAGSMTPPGSFVGPPFHTMPPMGKGGPPFQTMAPPGHMGPPPSGAFGHGNQRPLLLIEVDKITDIPAPPDGGKGDLMLFLERDDADEGKLLAPPIGPYKMDAQGGNLRQALDLNALLVAPVDMQDLGRNSMVVRIVAKYVDAQLPIGFTETMTVSWKPDPTHYVAIKDGTKRVVGGIYLSHRWANEAEVQRSMMRFKGKGAKGGKGFPMPVKGTGKGKAMNAPDQTTGRSGRFAKNSKDEVIENAAIAVEAQNRALVQRLNQARIYDTECSDDQNTKHGAVWEGPNGYREWSNLDSLFITMGPNYVAQSEEMGSNLVRVYEEETSVWKELRNKPGLKPMHPQDEKNAKELVQTIYPVNTDMPSRTLRPVICKDVKSINAKTLDQQGPKPILRVKLLNAMNLRTKKSFLSFGKMEPRVIVQVPGNPSAKWESQVASDAEHVQWNEAGIVPNWNLNDDLHIMVVDRGFLGFAGETHLGEARLRYTDFHPEPWTSFLPLKNSGPQGNTGKYDTGAGPASQKFATLHLEVSVEEPQGAAGNWPPSNPTYAMMRHLNESDQETQRLANWDVHQNSKLPFADVSPNYQINEDIWGGSAVNLEERIFLKSHEPWEKKRVKDACPIA